MLTSSDPHTPFLTRIGGVVAQLLCEEHARPPDVSTRGTRSEQAIVLSVGICRMCVPANSSAVRGQILPERPWKVRSHRVHCPRDTRIDPEDEITPNVLAAAADREDFKNLTDLTRNLILKTGRDTDVGGNRQTSKGRSR